MLLIDEKAALECVKWIMTRSIKYAYDRGMLLCFRVFRGILADLAGAPGIHAARMRVFFMQEGFARLHLGLYPKGETDAAIIKNTACHPTTDIFAHGWKSIGTALWIPNAEKCLVGHAEIRPGKNSLCFWLSPEQEYVIAREMCFWRSPMCAGSVGSPPVDINNSNKCFSSDRCRVEQLNLQRWRLCKDHNICNPMMTLKTIQAAMHNETFLQRLIERNLKIK